LLTIIFPFRNRDLLRLQYSFDSLAIQSNLEFEVAFVDYGSNYGIAKATEKLCSEYSFINYNYIPSQYQPWNKSKALNSVIKKLNTDFCFVADVDMIFHPHFVQTVLKLRNFQKVVYFQVGYLAAGEIIKDKVFAEFKNFRKSNYEATGLSLFPVDILKELRGFDEFYHFWGAEDTDIHVRIKNAGYQIEFFNDETLILHQWHYSYLSKESNKLSKVLRLSGIIQLNHQRLKYVTENKIIKANNDNWGECIDAEEINELEKALVTLTLDNEQCKIDHMIYCIMPTVNNAILKFTVVRNSFHNSFGFRVKKFLKRKVPQYYTLLEINDKILLHLITFYRDKPFTYKVSDDLKSIEVAVKL
jgi:hypothetical protein